ncbi:Rpn family recombination-promoting nuclease/putative transposase [Polyangium aurulentum]|uniref:Rpn family recombination-promoting nuclease/putative transposase n=1 Tax=Polyangium aurulentum TaxID=2567896 RepID=UPI0010ADE037|nr:Rpn family recombination-promoting nuclease/putative transposase [Polyangium aurulentum]UQA61707.1 Rpn family recombination-promoting nuclease/putative transposase [Polyangium aurulentum]
MGDHDALFKAIFSQPEHAAGELSVVLPRALAERIDFSVLARASGSFVDPALTERHTDLLFATRIAGQEALLYVLFEHLSYVDPLMAFRLLRYMVRIWDEHLKKHPNARRLPIIVPVVLHHSDTGWTASTTFESLMDVDAQTLALVAPYVPCFRIALDDISHESDAALRARPMSALARFGLGLLARAPDELLREAESWAPVVAEAQSGPHGPAALGPALSYILKTNKASVDQIKARLIRAWGGNIEEVIVTAADQLREEGRKDGIAKGQLEGVAKGQRQTLLKLLQRKFGPLPEPITARVNAAGTDDLDRWLDLILTAPTLDDVFAVEG